MLTRAADDLILGSGLQVGSRMSSMRQVQVRTDLPAVLQCRACLYVKRVRRGCNVHAQSWRPALGEQGEPRAGGQAVRTAAQAAHAAAA